MKRKLLFLSILFLTAINSWAYDFMADVIAYKITSSVSPYTVAVTEGGIYGRYINIPSTVSNNGIVYSVTSIQDHAFYNCNNLDSITIPEGVTSIGQAAFWQCFKLKSVKIPNSLTTLEDAAFSSCSLLTTLVFPKGLTTIKRDVFGGCSELTTITIPYGNDISYGYNIFGGCSKLKTIIIPDGITSIKNYAFNACPANVTTFKIPASVKSIGDQAFANCTGIDSISIPDSVTTIGAYTFSGCTGLKSLSIPNSVTKLGIYSLRNCSNLSSINLPITLSVIDEGVFSGCTKLASFSFPTAITSLSNSAFSGCTSLVITNIPETVTSIGESCFSGCIGLKSIVIPSSVNVINNTTFSGCTGLTSVQFPNSYITIGYQAFLGCNGLTSITLPTYSSITYNAFQDCKGLLIATTPYAYNSGNIFAGCVNLKTIIIPWGMSSIKDYAFYNCNTLDSINIPTSVYAIGNNSFNGCSSLKKFSLPKYLYSIGDYALANCTSLTSISFPTTLPVISNNCFSGCSGLTTVTIPVSVNTISSNSFNGCTGLNSINVENSFPIDLTKFTLVFNNVNKTTCTLNVPYGTKSRYSAANQWSDFTNIIEKSTGIFVSSNKVELSANPGSTFTLDVKANVAWTASSNQSWVTLTPTSGTGDNILTFTADNTQITTIRKAFITISAPGYISQSVEVTQKLSPKTIDISAGGLSTALTADELSSLSTLTVTGTMDARDFKTIRDNMPLLESLDLSAVTISAYLGTDGTLFNSSPISYASNSIPIYAFYNSINYLGKVSLKSVILPKTLTSIGSTAFENCTGLTSINIPGTVNSIAYYAFYNCQGLNSVYVNTSIPINLGDNWSAFYLNNSNCVLYVPYASKALYASAGQWSVFTKIVENAQGFKLSTNKVKLPYNAGSTGSIGIKSNVAWTVSSDQSWLTVNPASGSGDSTLILTTEVNQTATTRKAIVTVSAPDNYYQTIEVVQNIAPKTIDISAGGLSTALTTEELNSLSSLIVTGTMDARDFKTLRDKMPLLTELDLTGTSIFAYTGTDGTYPYIVSTIYPANTIPQYAFYGKINLYSVLIPSTVVTLDNYVFQNCSSLTSFIIPSTINSIGFYAFYGCTGLTSIYSNTSYPIDLSNSYSVFYNVNKTTCTLNVPYKAKALYAAAYQWSAFTNIVENTQGLLIGSNKIKLSYENSSTGTMDISANVNWTVSSDQSWLTVSPESGTGDSKLTFTVERNDSTSRRYAKVKVSSPGIGSQIITVSQTGYPKTINITAGGLSTSLTADELSNTADLAITGTMDARDFKTMRDLMPELARLDLSGATIAAFSGDGGTYDFSAGYSANTIPPSAFYVYSQDRAKTSLISIKIPSTVSSIGYSAFQSCTGLTSVYINSIYPIDFTNSGDPFYKTNKAGCTLYVPYGTKPYYTAASGWKDFMNIVENAQGFLVSQRAIKFAASTIIKTISFTVKGNVAWTAQSNQPWLVTSSNDSIVTLTADANPSDSIRKATVIVSSTGFDTQTVDITQAAAPRKVTAGSLSSILTSTELSNLTEIALMGTIDARDFKTMRDNMPALANIDLAGVNVVAYEGPNCDLWGGTDIKKYPANEIPYQAFYMSKKIKSMIMPQTVTSIGEYAFGSTSVSSVTFSKSLNSIGIYAFSVCTDLSSISLPDSLVVIGEYAFFGCSNLSGSLRIPSSLKTIRAAAFYNCSGLSGDLTIPSTVDSININAFNSCYNLSTLVIDSSKTSIGDYAFSGCWGLTKVTLPSTLTTIGKSIFASCFRLESINLPSTLKSIGDGAFSGTGLSSITFPATLTSIGASSFAGSKLTTITIPVTLTDIGERAFSGCTSLNTVSLPSTLKMIPTGLFSGCSNLNPIELPSALETIGDNAFTDCTSLATINLTALVTTIGANAFADCSGLKSINLPSQLSTISYNAFYNCTGLTSINIPASVKTIGYSAFSGCSRLTAVTLPPTLSIIDGKVFENCTSLFSITIPSTVKSIGDYAFSSCKSLTTLIIPSPVETLGESSFYNCTGLTKIDFSIGLKSIGASAFGNCTGITTIVIPSSVLSLAGNVFEECSALKTVTLSENLQTIGAYCFYDCINLSNIDLPNTLTSFGSNCFMGCSALKSIVIPPLITSVGYLVFANCTNLTSVTLNSNIVSLDMYAFSGCGFKTILLPNTLKTIDYEAFAYCNNLTTITIPSKVTKIGEKAFMYCSNLTSINIPASVTMIGPGAFSACPGISTVYAYTVTPVDMSFSGDGFWGIDKTTCILYVPIGKKTAYLNTMYWKDFTHIIEMPTAIPTLNAEEINIYLDPVSESFRIHGIEGIYTISIYDMNGRAMLCKQVQSNENISISNFPTGLYVVRIITKEGTIVQKVLKN